MYYNLINDLVTIRTKELDTLVFYVKKHLDRLRQEVEQGYGYWDIDRNFGRQQIDSIEKIYALSMEMSCLSQQEGYFQFERKENTINIKLFNILLSLIKKPMHFKYNGGEQEITLPLVYVRTLLQGKEIEHEPSIHPEKHQSPRASLSGSA